MSHLNVGRKVAYPAKLFGEPWAVKIQAYAIVAIQGSNMTTMKGDRPRLMVLLGAGASAHAGVPSTEAVTERVGQLDNAAIKAIVNSFKAKGWAGFNFETVMAALEDLQEYQEACRFPGRGTRGTLSMFTELAPEYVGFAYDGEPLHVFNTRIALLSGIFDFFIRGTPQQHPDRLQGFVDRLRRDFELTVLTLNYDDLIDRTGAWFDGFATSNESADYEVFNPGQFVERVATEPNVLLHLHGSVRFGRTLRSGTDIVKYHSVEAARAALIGGERSPQWAVPIVSGHQKERWLQRYVAPLGYYYNAFVNTAVSTPLWLIAGYGANDVHVNTWVMESMRMQKEEARVVHIDRKDMGTGSSESLGPPEFLPGFSSAGQPRLKPCYGARDGDFPPHRDALEAIMAFLQDTP